MKIDKCLFYLEKEKIKNKRLSEILKHFKEAQVMHYHWHKNLEKENSRLRALLKKEILRPEKREEIYLQNYSSKIFKSSYSKNLFDAYKKIDNFCLECAEIKKCKKIMSDTCKFRKNE